MDGEGSGGGDGAADGTGVTVDWDPSLRGYITGATFGLPCLESCVGSSSTNADGFPKE